MIFVRENKILSEIKTNLNMNIFQRYLGRELYEKNNTFIFNDSLCFKYDCM